MSGFSARLDDGSVRRELTRLSQRLSSLRKPLTAVGQTLVTESDLCFREQRDPWGNPWTALKASTIRQRRGKSRHKILRDTGRLQNSVSYQVDQESVTVGTDVEYAAIHQFGGNIRQKRRTINIPARPYLPIRNNSVELTDEVAEEVLEILRRHLKEATL